MGGLFLALFLENQQAGGFIHSKFFQLLSVFRRTFVFLLECGFPHSYTLFSLFYNFHTVTPVPYMLKTKIREREKSNHDLLRHLFLFLESVWVSWLLSPCRIKQTTLCFGTQSLIVMSSFWAPLGRESHIIIRNNQGSFSQFSCSVVSNSLWPYGLHQARPPCPSPTPGTYSNSCSLSRWCHLTISSSFIPFSSCLQSFSASGSFQMSQFFASGGQRIGVSASASILPMNF